MAEQQKSVSQNQAADKGGASSPAAIAARKASRAKTSNLPADLKYIYGLLARAAAGIRLVQNRVKNGDKPSAEVVQAASMLAGAAASEIC